MSISSDIEQIVSTIYEDSVFLLSSYFHANVQSFDFTESQLPLIILNNEISSEGSIQKNNNLLERERIAILILDLDTSCNSDAQTNTIVDVCKTIARRLAVNIFQLPNVRLESAENQRYTITPKFHQFAQNLSGCELLMNVKYNTTVNFCKQ